MTNKLTQTSKKKSICLAYLLNVENNFYVLKNLKISFSEVIVFDHVEGSGSFLGGSPVSQNLGKAPVFPESSLAEIQGSPNTTSPGIARNLYEKDNELHARVGWLF